MAPDSLDLDFSAGMRALTAMSNLEDELLFRVAVLSIVAHATRSRRTTSPKRTLCSLPEDILRRILEFLLSAKEVKNIVVSYPPPDAYGYINGWFRTTIHDFSTGVL